jgi:hypothetical protein
MNPIFGRAAALLVLALPAVAHAEIDPKCAGLPIPDDYDEQVQQDFLQNYFALTTTLSPQHGPVPHLPGHGAITVDVGVIPPLGCEKRYVLNWGKTEETNKAPAVPRPRVSFALPVGDNKLIVPYAGVAYLPPITLLGTRNVILSGEVGIGFRPKGGAQFGARFHTTTVKTVADVATAFTAEEPAVDDLYLASTFGFDGMVGYKVGDVVPYAAIGFTDVSSFFYIGDDGIPINNLHPYAGLTFSLGADALLGDIFRFGAEFYGAPGGYSLPDKTVTSVDKGSRYGHVYTGRFRAGIEF